MPDMAIPLAAIPRKQITLVGSRRSRGASQWLFLQDWS